MIMHKKAMTRPQRRVRHNPNFRHMSIASQKRNGRRKAAEVALARNVRLVVKPMNSNEVFCGFDRKTSNSEAKQTIQNATTPSVIVLEAWAIPIAIVAAKTATNRWLD